MSNPGSQHTLENNPEIKHTIPMNHTIQLEQLSDSPRIYFVHNILTEEECDILIEESRAKMKRSTTVDPQTGEFILVDARTSSGAFYQRGETEVVGRLESRIANLLQIPVDHGEGLQILNYQLTQEYKPHFDFFDPALPGSHKALATGGQRVATLIMYLNTAEAGGETIFPEIKLSVPPTRCNGVLFYNCFSNGDVDRMTLHGSAPVITGEKWIATKWLRERPYI